MKNKTLKILFLTLLPILVLFPYKVKGVENTQRCTDKVATRITVEATTEYRVTLRGVKNGARFFTFGVGDNIALCLDSGKNMEKGLDYALTSLDEITDTDMIKAYEYAAEYAAKDPKDIMARIVAQSIVWLKQQGYTSIDDAEDIICGAKIQNTSTSTTTSVDSCSARISAIKSKPGTTKIYTWTKKDGDSSYQRLIAKVDAGYVEQIIPGSSTRTDLHLDTTSLKTIIEKPETDVSRVCWDEEKCHLTVVNNLATCNDDDVINSNTQNAGKIEILAEGDGCADEYKDSKTGLTKDGTVETQDGNNKYWNVRCLESFAQVYPGNIYSRAYRGGYIVWPNNNIKKTINGSNESNKIYQNKIAANLETYPLKVSLQKKCRMRVNKEEFKNDYSSYMTELKKLERKSSKYGQKAIENFKGKIEKDGSVADKICDNADVVGKKPENSAGNDCSETSSYARCFEKGYVNGNTFSTSEDECARISGGTCIEGTHEIPTEAQKIYEDKNKTCTAYKAQYDKARNLLIELNTLLQNNNVYDNISVKDFNISYQVKYSGKNYSGTYGLSKYKSEIEKNITAIEKEIPKISTAPLSVDTSDFDKYVDANVPTKESQTATISRSVWYDLDENLYRYVNKKTGKSLSSLGDITKNMVTDIGFGNLPISNNEKIGSHEISLEINDGISGITNNNIKEALVAQNYTCKYNVTGGTVSCVCPENSSKSGTNLLGYIADGKMTCAEAQATYCYTGDDDDDDEYKCEKHNGKYYGKDGDVVTKKEYKKQCQQPLVLKCEYDNGKWYNSEGKEVSYSEYSEDCHYYCPSDSEMPGISLDDCMATGAGLKNCKKTCNIMCPEGNDPTDEMSTNFRSCVAVKLKQGYSLENAKTACNQFCNVSGGNIIYRTISLTNPFPGYNATNNNKNISIGDFNSTIKGRYPGLNWNSKTVVSTKILDNRNTEGDTVYNKEPLYKFVLDSKTIRDIRKYNKEHKYDDFKLKCKNGAACISEFIHGSGNTLQYGLSSGTCSKNLTYNNFYTCGKE